MRQIPEFAAAQPPGDWAPRFDFDAGYDPAPLTQGARRGSRRGPDPPAGGPLLLRRPAAGRAVTQGRTAAARPHRPKPVCADPATRSCAGAEQTDEDERSSPVRVRSWAELNPK